MARVFVRIDIDNSELQQLAGIQQDTINNTEEYIDRNLYEILDKCNYHYNIIDVRDND